MNLIFKIAGTEIGAQTELTCRDHPRPGKEERALFRDRRCSRIRPSVRPGSRSGSSLEQERIVVGWIRKALGLLLDLK